MTSAWEGGTYARMLLDFTYIHTHTIISLYIILTLSSPWCKPSIFRRLYVNKIVVVFMSCGVESHQELRSSATMHEKLDVELTVKLLTGS
jgi:hypothetical protein